jgi:hypothetical protein
MPEAATWLEELSSWVYVVLVGGWLLQRWARKVAHPRSKQGGLDRLHARWPSFRRDELEELVAAHGGNAEATGATIQQQVLSGEHPSVVEIEMTKEDASTRLGCTLTGQPSHLPSVSGITPGSLAAASLGIGDIICRVNGEPAAVHAALLHLSITLTHPINPNPNPNPNPNLDQVSRPLYMLIYFMTLTPTLILARRACSGGT